MRKHEPVISGKLLDRLQAKEGFSSRVRGLLNEALMFPELPMLTTEEELDYWCQVYAALDPKLSNDDLLVRAGQLMQQPAMPPAVRERTRRFLERLLVVKTARLLRYMKEQSGQHPFAGMQPN